MCVYECVQLKGFMDVIMLKKFFDIIACNATNW